jgi:hypothetical protein
MDAGQIHRKCIHNKCMEIDKKCQRLKKYKKPISLYYLSDVGVSLQATPLRLAKIGKTDPNKVCIRCS